LSIYLLFLLISALILLPYIPLVLLWQECRQQKNSNQEAGYVKYSLLFIFGLIFTITAEFFLAELGTASGLVNTNIFKQSFPSYFIVLLLSFQYGPTLLGLTIATALGLQAKHAEPKPLKFLVITSTLCLAYALSSSLIFNQVIAAIRDSNLLK
jgi:hypothetical protein